MLDLWGNGPQADFTRDSQPSLANPMPRRSVARFDLEGALRKQQASTSLNAAAVRRQERVAGNHPLMSGLFEGYRSAPSSKSSSMWDGNLFSDIKNAGRWTLGNTIGKPLQGAMKAIDFAGNAMLLGAEELSEAVSGPLFGRSEFNSQLNDDGTLNEFGKQSNWDKLNDSDYGFGKLFDPKNTLKSKNKWVNRGIGFAGDVVLDPTTYLFPGAGKFAGLNGRVAAANTLDAANKAAAKAARYPSLGQGVAGPIEAMIGPIAPKFTKEGMEAVGKYGVSHADDAMRAQLNMGRSGLRFGLTQANSVRIPGTGAFANKTGRGLSAARAKIMSSPAGTGIAKMRVNKDMVRPLAVLQGRAAGDASVALADLASINTRRLGTGMVHQVMHDKNFAKSLRSQKVDGRKALTHQVEAGGVFDPSSLAGQAKAKFAKLAELADEAGSTGQEKIANYVKHVTTHGGRKALNDGAVTLADGAKFKVNMAQSKGQAYARNFKKDTDYVVTPVDGSAPQKVRLNEATIKEINNVIGGALGGKSGKAVKVLEDDFALIWERAVADAADDIGVATALQKLQRTHPEYVKDFREIMGTAPVTADEILAMGGINPALASKPERMLAEARAARRSKVVGEAQSAVENRGAVVDASWSDKTTKQFNKYAKSGKLGPEIKQMVDEEFELISTQIRARGDEVVMEKELARSFERVAEVSQKSWFWEVYDEYTRFFKTYATMSPGFHIRNGMSAMFMNASDGIGAVDHVEAMRLMVRWTREGEAMFDDPDLPSYVRGAFEAAWGSGMRGNVSATEVGIGQGGAWRDSLEKYGRVGNAAAKGISRAGDNTLSRASASAGTFMVEGPMRLAVSLNTFKRSGKTGGLWNEALVDEALARITRLHFDYSQLSSADEVMKRLIPFWTFMSRNLPLQIQQQFLKPRAYARYNHLRKNFNMGEDNDVVPQQWDDMGAFKIGDGLPLGLSDNPIYAAPDLPFTRLEESVESFTNPSKFLANFNPMARVAAELTANRKFYSGNEFYPDENKWLYALSALIPPAARIDSLSGGWLTAAAGSDGSWKKENQLGALASFLGAPAKELTPARYDAELRRMAREGE